MSADKQTPFKDHFSGHAQDYSNYRPGYPDALYRWLFAQVGRYQLAWDVGTGNGQAARGLAKGFARVHATDASARQIDHASGPASVHFAVEPAEACSLPTGSADLICVGQAMHWFSLDSFYAEVMRVLHPHGLFATWTYQLTRITPEIDAVVRVLYDDIVGPYWPAERIHVENGYQDLPFPFREVCPPEFELETIMNLGGLISYLRTWSSVQRYQSAVKNDPLDQVSGQLHEAWGDPHENKAVHWPMALRAGRLMIAD